MSTTAHNDRKVQASDATKKTIHHSIVIVGGGTGGVTVAAQLTKGWFNKTDVAIIDPSDKHYYQPAWTLVGGGAFRQEATQRDESSVIPRKAVWIQDAAAELHPDENYLLTRSGANISYDWLVVAAGIQINWDGVKGLKETIGENGVCSNYSYQTVGYTWECVRNFQGGVAIFTQPSGAIKCGGAPQKICYLAEDYFRKHGIRDKTKVIFAASGGEIFAVEKYKKALEKVVRRKGVETMFRHDLIAVSPDTHEAIFKHMDTGEEVSVHYDKNPAETFPFDQSKERLSMYMLKKYGLPLLYWKGMLKGRA